MFWDDWFLRETADEPATEDGVVVMTTAEATLTRRSTRRAFTMIDQEISQSLAGAAELGVYVRLLEMPEGSRIGARHLATLFTEGRDKMAGCLTALLRVGALMRLLYRGGSGQILTRYVVLDKPADVDDLLEEAARLEMVSAVVSVELARRMQKIGYTCETTAGDLIKVTGFNNSASHTGVQESGPGADDAAFPLVRTGVQESGPGADDPSSTGSGFLDSHKVKDPSSNPSLRFQPIAESVPDQSTSTEGGMNTNESQQEAPCDEPPQGEFTEQVTSIMKALFRVHPRSAFSLGQIRSLQTKLTVLCAGGHSEAALIEELIHNPAGMRMPGRALLARLSQLPEKIAATELLVQPTIPWCGSCDPRTRHVTHQDYVTRCPLCHPAVAQRPAEDPAATVVAPGQHSSDPDRPSQKRASWRHLLREVQQTDRGELDSLVS